METKVYAQAHDYGNKISFLIMKEINGARHRAKVDEDGRIFWEEYESQANLSDPKLTIQLEREDAQKFADKLYQLGFKPSDKPPLENELTATKAHLEDMRRIVSVYTKSNLTKEAS